MDIDAVTKRHRELLVLREVGEHAELDLRVVRTENAETFGWHERRTNQPAHITANGNVLQVRIRRRETPRRRNRLLEAGMNTTRLRIHRAWKRVEIRALQL